MSFTNGDIAKVDLRYNVGSIGFAVNVFQAVLVQSTPHAIADLDVLTDMGAWITRVLDPMQPHIVVSVDVEDCNVYKKVGPLWNLVGPAPVIFEGLSNGDPLPSGVAALMVAYTDTSKVMGKKYLPGLSEVAQTAGLWVGPVLAAMLQSCLEWVDHFAALSDPTSEWYPGVWSLKAVGFRIFAAHIAARDIPAYQRRRKEGVGV